MRLLTETNLGLFQTEH